MTELIDGDAFDSAAREMAEMLYSDSLIEIDESYPLLRMFCEKNGPRGSHTDWSVRPEALLLFQST